MTDQDSQQPILCVGIDWADSQHAFHLLHSDGSVISGSIEHDPAVIHTAVDEWRGDDPTAVIAVAIEQSRGPLINLLLSLSNVEIYPVNPAALASYRKAFAHGGGKNDPSDAMLLCQYLHHYRNQLRPLRPNDPITRELASLSEDRRQLVDGRAALANALRAALKQYFPAALQLDAAQMYADFLVRFLLKYPSLEEARQAGATRLRRWFHGIGLPQKAQERVDLLMNAVPLTTDPVVIRCSVRKVLAILRQIESLNKSIDQYDADIRTLVRKHADYPIVSSLPGASDKTHCRLIAALGDDRSRYDSAEALQAASGIAPITIQSGRQKTVVSRWACSKFMKQTFHEFAQLSIRQSQWAKAYYGHQRALGKPAQAVWRALAYKWIRIIFRCWKDRTPYNEKSYIQRLRETGSPIANLLT